jgi:hypothetical protein
MEEGWAAFTLLPFYASTVFKTPSTFSHSELAALP